MNAPRLSTILMLIGYPILFAVFFVDQPTQPALAALGGLIAFAAAITNYCGD
jgi:hypothetical protein